MRSHLNKFLYAVFENAKRCLASETPSASRFSWTADASRAVMRQRNRLNGAYGEVRVDTLAGLERVQRRPRSSPPHRRPRRLAPLRLCRHRLVLAPSPSRTGLSGDSVRAAPALDRARKRKREEMARAADPLPTLSFDGRGAVYVALVLGGLADPAAREIREKLGVPASRIFVIKYDDERRRAVGGEASVDKIVFQTSRPASDLRALRCPQGLLAFLAMDAAPPRRGGGGGGKGKGKGKDKEKALEWFGALVASSEFWPEALALWRAHSGVSAAAVPDASLSFRASAVRDGKHEFNSMDVAGALGAACQDKYGWRVDLSAYDVEVNAIITQHTVVVGVTLPRAPRDGSEGKSNASHSKLAGEPRHLLSDDYRRASTLRPSTAHQMLLLADIKPGEIVCDCMCGVGTIPLEASAMFPGNIIYSFGGELAEDSLSVAGSSAALSNRRAAAAGIDAAFLRQGRRDLAARQSLLRGRAAKP